MITLPSELCPLLTFASKMKISCYDAAQMRAWVQVDASLTRGGYETRSGEDSDTYEAYAVYGYSYDGARYTGSRVSLRKQASLGRLPLSTLVWWCCAIMGASFQFATWTARRVSPFT